MNINKLSDFLVSSFSYKKQGTTKEEGLPEQKIVENREDLIPNDLELQALYNKANVIISEELDSDKKTTGREIEPLENLDIEGLQPDFCEQSLFEPLDTTFDNNSVNSPVYHIDEQGLIQDPIFPQEIYGQDILNPLAIENSSDISNPYYDPFVNGLMLDPNILLEIPMQDTISSFDSTDDNSLLLNFEDEVLY